MDRLARSGNPKVFSFTKPKQEGRFDFSFSGIKTAALQIVERHRPSLRGAQRRSNLGIASALPGMLPRNDGFVADLCASFQESVMQWVTQKTVLACEEEQIKAVVVGGGVSANSRLRWLLSEEARARGIELFLPYFELTTDNAAMIARLGYSLFQKGRRSDFQMVADPSLRIGTEGRINGNFEHGH